MSAIVIYVIYYMYLKRGLIVKSGCGIDLGLFSTIVQKSPSLLYNFTINKFKALFRNNICDENLDKIGLTKIIK